MIINFFSETPSTSASLFATPRIDISTGTNDIPVSLDSDMATSSGALTTPDEQGRFLVPHFLNSCFADSGVGQESDEESIDEITTHGELASGDS